jgi:hypothetical protein
MFSRKKPDPKFPQLSMPNVTDEQSKDKMDLNFSAPVAGDTQMIADAAPAAPQLIRPDYEAGDAPMTQLDGPKTYSSYQGYLDANHLNNQYGAQDNHPGGPPDWTSKITAGPHYDSADDNIDAHTLAEAAVPQPHGGGGFVGRLKKFGKGALVGLLSSGLNPAAALTGGIAGATGVLDSMQRDQAVSQREKGITESRDLKYRNDNQQIAVDNQALGKRNADFNEKMRQDQFEETKGLNAQKLAEKDRDLTRRDQQLKLYQDKEAAHQKDIEYRHLQAEFHRAGVQGTPAGQQLLARMQQLEPALSDDYRSDDTRGTIVRTSQGLKLIDPFTGEDKGFADQQGNPMQLMPQLNLKINTGNQEQWRNVQGEVPPQEGEPVLQINKAGQMRWVQAPNKQPELAPPPRNFGTASVSAAPLRRPASIFPWNK